MTLELAGLEPVSGGEAAVWAFPQERRPIAAEIAGLARTRGWAIAGLYVERGRLDDVFRTIAAPVPAGEPTRDAA